MTAAAPLLRTANLELWTPQHTDRAGISAMLADKQTRRYLGAGRGEPADDFERLLRSAGSWSLYGYGMFTLRLHGAADIIGLCGVFRSWRDFPPIEDMPEAGWIIHRDHAGKGLAREAMDAALAWFDRAHGPARVLCMIEEGNTASQRLAAALGFVECGRREPDDDGSRALVFYERVGRVA